jgi:hypothetical protein
MLKTQRPALASATRLWGETELCGKLGVVDDHAGIADPIPLNFVETGEVSGDCRIGGS